MLPDRAHRPIRVLHLVSTFAIKTDTKWLVQLLPRLSRDRIESSIACLYGGGEMMQHFRNLGMPAVDLDSPGTISPSGVLRAHRLVRSCAPDVVHTHLLRADLVGGLAARLARVPVVLTSVYAMGEFRREKVRRIDPLLDRMSRAVATDALAVSHAVKADLTGRARWPAERVHVVYTGIAFRDEPVDPAVREAVRREWRVPPDAPLVIALSRLSYEKGIGHLVEAAARVRQDIPQVRFVVAGEGPLRGELEARIQQAGLTSVFLLPGFVRDVDAALAAGDVFVMPSLMEGMPNAVLEAYSAGLPVIASNVGGLAEAVEHEHSGLHVPPGDPGALAAAITRLLEDATLRRRLGEQGRAWARRRFPVDGAARGYEALYEHLVANRTQRRWEKVERSALHDPVAPG